MSGVKLEDLEVYQLSMELGDKIWEMVSNWEYFSKSTIGSQIARSADSVAANISEGYGRYFYKDAVRFYYYSRGSLSETKTWITKANNRHLIDQHDFEELLTLINRLGVKLNNFISRIKKSSNNNLITI